MTRRPEFGKGLHGTLARTNDTHCNHRAKTLAGRIESLYTKRSCSSSRQQERAPMAEIARDRESRTRLARVPSLIRLSAKRLRVAGVILATLTSSLAGFTVWDLNRRTLNVVAGEIRNLDLALAEETTRYLQ